MLASLTAAWIEAVWTIQGWLRPGRWLKTFPFQTFTSAGVLKTLQRLQVLWSSFLPSATCCWHFTVFYISVSLCCCASMSDGGTWNTCSCCRDEDTEGAHLETRMNPHTVMCVTAVVACNVAKDNSQLLLCCYMKTLDCGWSLWFANREEKEISAESDSVIVTAPLLSPAPGSVSASPIEYWRKH